MRSHDGKVTATSGDIFYAAPVTGPRDIPPHSRAPDADDRGRREPGMGTLSGLDFAPRTRPRRTGSRPLGWWPWLLAFVLLAKVLLGLFRKPMADHLGPQTRVQELRAQAAPARGDRQDVEGGQR